MKKQTTSLVNELLADFQLSLRNFIIFELIENSETPTFLALPKKRFSSEKEIELTDHFLEKIGYPIHFS